MLSSSKLAVAAATLGLLAASPIAQADLLTFDGNICDVAGGACSNGSLIRQNYGDVANSIDVVYDRVIGDGTPVQNLSYWAAQYSDLTNVAWGGGGDTVGTAEIFLQPLGGRSVTLTGFDLGSWPNFSRTTQVTILDGGGTPLYSSGTITVLGTTATHLSFNLASTTGLRIQWGPSAFNVGIDNVAFNVTAVPEPESWAMLMAGLGLLGLAARRRKAA